MGRARVRHVIIGCLKGARQPIQSDFCPAAKYLVKSSAPHSTLALTLYRTRKNRPFWAKDAL